MGNFPGVDVDRLIEHLKSPVDEVFKEAYYGLSKVPGLSSTVVDMYLDGKIDEQDFKDLVERWIAYESLKKRSREIGIRWPREDMGSLLRDLEEYGSRIFGDSFPEKL